MNLALPWSPEQRAHRRFVAAVATFHRSLRAVKKNTRADFDWYPYDSLGTWCRIDNLFGATFRDLLDRLAGETLLDIGCGDGDLSFFLESAGHRMHALDWPPTNHNGMRGVRALRAELGSAIEIHDVDLDAQFQLPVAHCSAALLLGVLYHLKNPFFVLEKLAEHARYCFFSTVVTRFPPDRRTDLRELPVAYLLDERELNSDATNHWIFSDAGLKRLLKKTNWEIVAYASQGNERESVPDSMRDELRVFGILKSTKLRDPADGVKLLGGWHGLEENRWRWTERSFEVELESPSGGQSDCILRLDFFVHERLLNSPGCITLTAAVSGVALSSAQYRSAGRHTYSAKLDAESVAASRVRVRFNLDHAIAPDASDPRERALIVLGIAIDHAESPQKP